MKKSLYFVPFLIGLVFLFNTSSTAIIHSQPHFSVEAKPASNQDTIGPVEAVGPARAQLDIDLQPVIEKKNWRNYIIKSGDSLSRIFVKLGFDRQVLNQILSATAHAGQLTRLYPGKPLKFLASPSGALESLVYQPNPIDTLEVVWTDSGYVTTKTSKTIEHRVSQAHASIQSSLYKDAKAAGLGDQLVLELAKIFAWDIDFALEIRRGDHFTVIYDQLYVDNQFYRSGRILAAEFVNQGKTYTAVRFVDKEGTVAYYTPNGDSLHRAFLRTPVEFARISSHFNLRRRHPVLNRIRAHKGVDYAAPIGAPVRSTGNGKIVFRGRKGGYGRVVIVQHGKQYSTLYAHLSKFGKIAKGGRVKQGQTIGYVGKSGLATGPHLHYEFRINGVHRNPLTVKLPNRLPIPSEALARFKKDTTPLLNQLEMYRSTLLAQAEVEQAPTQ